MGQTFCKNKCKCKLSIDRFIRLYRVYTILYCRHIVSNANNKKLFKTNNNSKWQRNKNTWMERVVDGPNERKKTLVFPQVYVCWCAILQSLAHAQVNIFSALVMERFCWDLLQLQQYAQCLCVTIGEQIYGVIWYIKRFASTEFQFFSLFFQKCTYPNSNAFSLLDATRASYTRNALRLIEHLTCQTWSWIYVPQTKTDGFDTITCEM